MYYGGLQAKVLGRHRRAAPSPAIDKVTPRQVTGVARWPTTMVTGAGVAPPKPTALNGCRVNGKSECLDIHRAPFRHGCEFLAVVGEMVGKEAHDGLPCRADPDSIAGSADELAHCHNG